MVLLIELFLGFLALVLRLGWGRRTRCWRGLGVGLGGRRRSGGAGRCLERARERICQANSARHLPAVTFAIGPAKSTTNAMDIAANHRVRANRSTSILLRKPIAQTGQRGLSLLRAMQILQYQAGSEVSLKPRWARGSTIRSVLSDKREAGSPRRSEPVLTFESCA